jgi:succinoglycan biosynthesis protein ExoA
MTDSIHASTHPVVSVVIPCRNEERFIAGCLNSVFDNHLTAGAFEVLVADGASTDRTRRVLAGLMERYSNLKVFDNSSGSIPAGLNRMIRAARGRYIIRFDAHSEMPSGYLQRCVDVLEQTGASNVGGVCITVPRDNTPAAQAISYVTSHWFGVGGSPFRCGAKTGPSDTVVFGAFRREVFDDVGLFDERLLRNQDNEFNSRLRKHGKLVWLEPDIKVTYYNQATLGGLVRQAYRTGQWNMFTFRLARYAARFRHLAPGLFVCLMAFCLILIMTGLVTGSALLTLSGAFLPAPYLLLLLASSAPAVWRMDRSSGILVPIVFVTYHIVYGVGILHGAALLIGGRWKQSLGKPELLPVAAEQ